MNSYNNMPSDTSTGLSEPKPSREASSGISPSKPAWLLWMPWLSYTAVLVAALAFCVRMTSPSDATAQLVYGFVVGLAMILTVIAGLAGRCWLSGIWRVTAICTIAALVIVVSESSRQVNWQESTERAIETSFSFFVIPLVISATASPLLLMRIINGWRLCERNRVENKKFAIGLDQLLLVVTSIAAMMFMTKVPQNVWDIPATVFWLGVLPIIGVLAGLSLLTTVPTVWFMFRYDKRNLAWLFSLIYVALAVAVVLQVTMWIERSGPTWKNFLFTPIIAALVFTVGLFILRRSGFELGTFMANGLPASLVNVETSELTDETNNPASSSSPKRNHLLWTGFTLLVAATSSVALALIEAGRLKADSNMSQLAAQLRADGGNLLCEKRQPWRIEVGKSATDESVLQLSSFQSLKELSLAGSQITDATLEQLPIWFPQLQRLDLDHTRISSRGLHNIRKLKTLRNLGLAGTTLTIAEINQAIQPQSTVVLGMAPTGNVLIDQLDLSETGFTSGEVIQLDSVIKSLAIRDLKFNDQDIAKVCQRSWTKLDISRNPISGSGLNYQNIASLVARDVPLTDQNVAAVARVTKSSLEIANTQLTDKSLVSFVGVQHLVIGDGQITDAGIQNALSTQWRQYLRINGKGSTGECLLKMQQWPYWMDLSHSGITDSMLTRLGSTWKSGTGFNSAVSLSDTNISDIGLQGLNGCVIPNLDISRTKVTAQAVINLELPNCQGIYVDFNQFTPAELKAIRKRHTVVVGEFLPGSMDP